MSCNCEMIKVRYLLFAGDNYYPSGGWDDFIGSYDILIDAQFEGTSMVAPSGYNPSPRRKYVWYHIVDSLTLKVVEES